MTNRGTIETTDAPAPPFEDHFSCAFHDLRGALTELLLAVDADPNNPQEMARRFKLNKNLTWKISKIVNATDAYASVQHIPGTAGMEILLKALKGSGAGDHATRSVRQAMSEFDRMVEVHTGDRATLDLILANKSPDATLQERRIASRRLAYQGNSGTWGVQAKVRLATYILAPSTTTDGYYDMATISGLVALRRLRGDVSWPMTRFRHSPPEEAAPTETQIESLDPDYPIDQGLPLIGAFCSDPLPDVRAIPMPGGTLYELAEGPVGNTGASTMFFGAMIRPVGSKFATSTDLVGEHPTAQFTPVETTICDLLVHEDLNDLMPPDVTLYSRLAPGPDFPHSGRDRDILPIAETVQSLGAGPPSVATPLIPEYPRMIDSIFDRVQWNPRQFHGYRFMMRYPPIPTLVLLHYRLRQR